MNRQKNIFIVWVMILTVLIGNANISNTFLCFGEDGHVEIEYGLCTENISETDKKVSLSDDCGTCTDVPLFSSNITYLNKFSFSAFNFVPETGFIFSAYYPFALKKDETKPLKSFVHNENKTFYHLTYINTDTVILLN